MADEKLFGASPDDPGNTDEPKRPKRPARSKPKKGDVFAADECTEKLHQLDALCSRIMQTSKKRKASDFAEEGAALSRLSEKYVIVSIVLKSLDPLFFIVGTANKFGEHFSEFSKRKKAEKEARRAAENGVAGVAIIESGQGYDNQTATHYPS